MGGRSFLDMLEDANEKVDRENRFGSFSLITSKVTPYPGRVDDIFCFRIQSVFY